MKKVMEAATEARAEASADQGRRGGIVVQGIDDVAVRFSKCCSPIPGDEIVGFVTRGRGVTIHRTDCINVMNLSAIRTGTPHRRGVAAEQAGCQRYYAAEINVYANNRTGLLVDISRIFTERKIDLSRYECPDQQAGNRDYLD